MKKEVWKDISGYDGIYQVSSHGRVKSMEVVSDGNMIIRSRKEKILSPKIFRGKNGKGKQEFRVTLFKDGRRKDFLVSRLVCRAFRGDPPSEDFTTNHKDGNKFNNHESNLEWLTRGDNVRHGFETGLYSTLKKVNLVKDGKVHKFKSYTDASLFLKRNPSYISYIIRKKSSYAYDMGKNRYKVVGE